MVTSSLNYFSTKISMTILEMHHCTSRKASKLSVCQVSFVNLWHKVRERWSNWCRLYKSNRKWNSWVQNSISSDGNYFSFNIPSSSVGSKGSNNNFRFDCKNSWDENMCEYRRYILSIVVCEISFVWRLSHGWSAAYIFRRTFSSPGESAAKLLLYKSSRKWKGIKSLFQLFSCSSTFNSTRSWKLHSRNVKSRVEPTIKVKLIYGTLHLRLCCKKAQLKSFFRWQS